MLVWFPCLVYCTYSTIEAAHAAIEQVQYGLAGDTDASATAATGGDGEQMRQLTN